MRYADLSKRFDVSLLCLMPLAAVYVVSVFFLRAAPPNGADFLTPVLWRLGGRTALLIFSFAVAVCAFVLFLRLRKVGFRLSLIVGVAAEGLMYAGVMAVVLMFVVRYALPTSLTVTPAGVVAVSAGAGLWEELLFRALLFWGFYRLLSARGGRGRNAAAFVCALLVSSALFSAAHFFSEPPNWGAFVYRLCAGALLCCLYAARGLAVCGFCHFSFDMMVLLRC